MATRLRSTRAKGRAAVLPGFGPKSTAALAVVGVHSLTDLEKRDPFEVYRALKEAGPRYQFELPLRADWRRGEAGLAGNPANASDGDPHATGRDEVSAAVISFA